MKIQASVFALLTLTSALAWADGDVYLCVDKDGNKEYRNSGPTKGCKKVELPSITTVPAPAKHSGTTAKAASAPSDFPKADGTAQKARDNDRKQILQDELKSEEQKLADLKKSYNNGEPERLGDEKNYAKYQERVASMQEDIARSEKNVDALKRELGRQQQ